MRYGIHRSENLKASIPQNWKVLAMRMPHLGQFLSKTFSLPYQRMMHGRQPTMDLQQLLAMIGGVGGLSLHITHSNAWLMATATARGSSILSLIVTSSAIFGVRYWTFRLTTARSLVWSSSIATTPFSWTRSLLMSSVRSSLLSSIDENFVSSSCLS